MVTMGITWQALLLDPRTCRKCRLLHTHQWRFQPGKDAFPKKLYGYGDVVGLGPVWDCETDRSMAHGGTDIGCRCRLSIHFDVSDLENRIKQLRGAIKT